MNLIIRDKSFYSKVAVIAIPIALQSLVNIGVNMMATLMLGSLGEVQLSASALANQFIQIYHIFCMGLGMGASVLIARFWGMKDTHNLKKVITIMLRLTIALGLLFTLLTALFPYGIMRLYTNEEEVAAAGVRYFRLLTPSYLLLGLSLTCTIVLRNVGQVKIPLICSCFAFVINIFFNWVFIFGNLGAPRMEIQGAALGTLLSRSFEFIFICGYFLFKDDRIKFRLRDMLIKCGDLVGDYIKISIPVLVSDALLAFGNSGVSMIFGRLGANFVAAQSISAVIMQVSTIVIQGVSQSSAIITGHTLGEGNVKKTQQEGYAFLGLGIALGLISGGIILLIGKPIMGLYHMTAETNTIALRLILATAIVVFFQATNNILTKGVLRGGGDTRFLMVADILFLWVASIPLGVLTGLVWHFPPFWVYIFIKIDQIIKAFWCVFRLRSGKWIKKVSKIEKIEGVK